MDFCMQRWRLFEWLKWLVTSSLELVGSPAVEKSRIRRQGVRERCGGRRSAVAAEEHAGDRQSARCYSKSCFKEALSAKPKWRFVTLPSRKTNRLGIDAI